VADVAFRRGVFEKLGEPGAQGGRATRVLGGQVFCLTDVGRQVVEFQDLALSGLSAALCPSLPAELAAASAPCPDAFISSFQSPMRTAARVGDCTHRMASWGDLAL
jgi:hypothetical protein